MEKGCIIELRGVSYSVGGKDILKDIDLCLEGGITYAIIGPSGSGKTSLLMLINGLISPTVGDIFYNGEPLSSLDMPTYRAKVPLMFQEPLLVSGDGRANLMLPYTLNANIDKSPSNEQLAEMLRMCGLGDNFLEKDISTFSGGEKQRLSLVRNLLLRTDVIMLDEPTSALDINSERYIVKLLKEFRDDALVLYVTHSYQLIRGADRIILLNEGKIQSITEKISKSKLGKLLEGSG